MMIRALICCLLTLAVVISVCMHTKPERDTHLREVSASVIESLKVSPPAGIVIPEQLIARMENDSIVTTMLDRMFVVEDYVAFTAGKIVVGGNEYVLSIGVLDNVFVLSQDDMAEKIVYRLREKKILD